MYVENLWLLCVTLFTLGAIVGYAMFRVRSWLEQSKYQNKYSALPKSLDPEDEDDPELANLKSLLQKQETEFQQYYQNVVTHYTKTIKLLEQFDNNYKTLSRHFQGNVFKIVNKHDLYKALEKSDANISNLSHRQTSRLMPLRKSIGQINFALKKQLKSALSFLSTSQKEPEVATLNGASKTAKVISNQEGQNTPEKVKLSSTTSKSQEAPSNSSQKPVNKEPVREVIRGEDLSKPLTSKNVESTNTVEHKNQGPIKREVLFTHGHKARNSGVAMRDVSIGLPASKED